MRSWDFRRLMAVALVLTTAFVTMPLSAADFAAARPVLGSVSAVGSVDLRGVGISQDGTLFSGDSIRSHEKGYAKILIGTGSKIELQEKTDVSINRDARGIQIAMNSGLVGFTARTPLRIDVAPFEVSASDDASGNVSIMSTTTAGVRAINGKVTVRNLKTSESFVLTKGQEQLLGLKDGVHGPSLGELATNVPSPVPAPTPAPAPQTPAGKTSGGGLAMDTGAWLAVIGGAAVAGIAIWGVVEAHNNKNDIAALGTKIDKPTATVAANQAANAAAQAALQAQIKAVSNANAIANAISQQQSQLAIDASLAAQAQSALAGNAAQLAIANNLALQIAQNNTALAALQTQISAAQASVAAGGNPAQLTALLAQEETLRASNNALGGQLRALLSNNGLQGGNNINTIGGPTITSASAPV